MYYVQVRAKEYQIPVWFVQVFCLSFLSKNFKDLIKARIIFVESAAHAMCMWVLLFAVCMQKIANGQAGGGIGSSFSRRREWNDGLVWKRMFAEHSSGRLPQMIIQWRHYNTIYSTLGIKYNINEWKAISLSLIRVLRSKHQFIVKAIEMYLIDAVTDITVIFQVMILI